MTKVNYDQEWFSLIITAIFIVTEIAILAMTYILGLTFLKVAFSIILFILYLLFFSVRIVVDRDGMNVSFGLGLISNYYPLSVIESTFVDTNDHIVSWIYNPYGKNKIVINFRGGTRIQLPIEADLNLTTALRFR